MYTLKHATRVLCMDVRLRGVGKRCCTVSYSRIYGGGSFFFFWFCITLFSEHGGSCIWAMGLMIELGNFNFFCLHMLNIYVLLVWRNVRAKFSARLSIAVQNFVAS